MAILLCSPGVYLSSCGRAGGEPGGTAGPALEVSLSLAFLLLWSIFSASSQHPKDLSRATSSILDRLPTSHHHSVLS